MTIYKSISNSSLIKEFSIATEFLFNIYHNKSSRILIEYNIIKYHFYYILSYLKYKLFEYIIVHIGTHDIFSKILVPIDGSEPSFHASQIASTIVDKFNAERILL